VPRPPPDGDAIAHVSRGLQQAAWLFRARVRVFSPAAELSRRLPTAVSLEPVDDQTCIAHVGADSPEILTHYLGMLGAEFEVVDEPELRPHLRALGERLLRAANAKPRSARGRRRAPR